MRIPKPKTNHPPEVYEAILRECGHRPVRLGEHLQACGWTMADAAWAAVNWDLPTLAAALANERANRNMKPTNLSDAGLARIKADQDEAAAKKTTAKLRPKKTTRIVPATPRTRPRTPRERDNPNE